MNSYDRFTMGLCLFLMCYDLKIKESEKDTYKQLRILFPVDLVDPSGKKIRQMTKAHCEPAFISLTLKSKIAF